MNPQAIPVIQPLKKTFVIVALIFLFIGFGIEYGGPNISFFQGLLSQSFLPTFDEMKENAGKGIDKHVREKWKNGKYPSVEKREIDRQNLKGEAYKEIEKLEGDPPDPPGYSLEADGLYLWVVFFSILISLIGMLITKASVHRVGMIISLINSIIVIFMSIFLIVKAILELIIMIILFMVGVPPFIPPVILYIAIYGSFPTLTVLTLGGLGLLCKIVAAVLLWIGGSQMIRIKSATLLLITGFVTFFVIELGLGLAGSFASIADAIIGIIIAIVVIIWSIFILIGSIRGLLSK
jgi:hypothetical protein